MPLLKPLDLHTVALGHPVDCSRHIRHGPRRAEVADSTEALFEDGPTPAAEDSVEAAVGLVAQLDLDCFRRVAEDDEIGAVVASFAGLGRVDPLALGSLARRDLVLG